VKPASLPEARAAKDKVAKLVRGSEVVNGVGIAKHGSGYAVKLNLARPATGEKLPSAVDGVPVRVEIVGDIKKRRAGKRVRRVAAPRRAS
jgi:hypothetical protein